MFLFDAHLDLGLNAVDWNRDLRMDVADIRVQETIFNMTDLGRQTNTVCLPELRKAEIGVCVATVLARIEQPINHSFGFTTPEACYAMAHAHLAYYRAMEKNGHMRLLNQSRLREPRRSQGQGVTNFCAQHVVELERPPCRSHLDPVGSSKLVPASRLARST